VHYIQVREWQNIRDISESWRIQSGGSLLLTRCISITKWKFRTRGYFFDYDQQKRLSAVSVTVCVNCWSDVPISVWRCVCPWVGVLLVARVPVHAPTIGRPSTALDAACVTQRNSATAQPLQRDSTVCLRLLLRYRRRVPLVSRAAAETSVVAAQLFPSFTCFQRFSSLRSRSFITPTRK